MGDFLLCADCGIFHAGINHGCADVMPLQTFFNEEEGFLVQDCCIVEVEVTVLSQAPAASFEHRCSVSRFGPSSNMLEFANYKSFRQHVFSCYMKSVLLSHPPFAASVTYWRQRIILHESDFFFFLHASMLVLCSDAGGTNRAAEEEKAYHNPFEWDMSPFFCIFRKDPGSDITDLLLKHRPLDGFPQKW